MVQKRYFDRFSASGRATIRIGDKSQDKVNVEIDEFSSKGIAVRSPQAFEIGADVEFELWFSFLEDIPIRGTGRIKHVTQIQELQRSYFKIGIESETFGQENFMIVMNSYLDYKRKAAQKKPSPGGKGLPF